MARVSGTSICTEAMLAAVPGRLEEAVGEAQRQDVLHRLLAQEVVDAEDLVLVDDVLEGGVELRELLQVEAEGLLDDQPGPVGEPLARRASRSCGSIALGGTER